MRLHHPAGDDDEYVEWETEVGAVDNWRAPWPVLLGQHDFMSRFTVSMHRGAALLVIEDFDCFDQRFGIETGEAESRQARFEP